jgi:hypothetical protein
MSKQHGRPPDDPSSAPESGTVRGPTSGNRPSDRNNDPRGPGPETDQHRAGARQPDDPSVAGEER